MKKAWLKFIKWFYELSIEGEYTQEKSLKLDKIIKKLEV
jgi:hypothetical protein